MPVFAPDAALGPLKQFLVERTEANPLFLEESVRALVETGALAGERGAYRLTRPVEHLKIPATVQAILAARIDRLVSLSKTEFVRSVLARAFHEGQRSQHRNDAYEQLSRVVD